MRPFTLPEIEPQGGQHPLWCARDHRCDYALGGEHRSLPEQWELYAGAWITVTREGRRNGRVVLRQSHVIPLDGEAAFADRLRRALAAYHQVLRGEG